MRKGRIGLSRAVLIRSALHHHKLPKVGAFHSSVLPSRIAKAASAVGKVFILLGGTFLVVQCN